MSYFDYGKFVHLVPAGHTIPKGTPTRRADLAPNPPMETFFAMPEDLLVFASKAVKFYLTYDITRPELPEQINSVIYNVNVGGTVYPVAVYQGAGTWSAFSVIGNRRIIYTLDIESFDTTPPKDEQEDQP